jgi:hypothetical protein
MELARNDTHQSIAKFRWEIENLIFDQTPASQLSTPFGLYMPGRSALYGRNSRLVNWIPRCKVKLAREMQVAVQDHRVIEVATEVTGRWNAGATAMVPANGEAPDQ